MNVFLSIVALSLLLTPATTNALSTTTTPTMTSSVVVNTLDDMYTIPNLQSKVAIVTGASRGIGRGIAIELGRAGMTVYVVGRSSTATGYISNERELGGGTTTLEDRNRYTVEGTVDEINALMINKGGGKAIPVPMDITNDEEIAKLATQVRNECNRLDLVVCSAFTTPPNLVNGAAFRDEFWNQGSSMWDACHTVGLRGSYVTCCECVPLMIDTAKNTNNAHSTSGTVAAAAAAAATTTRPLIVIISSFGGKSYTFNVAYGVGKAGADRLANDMSIQLAKYNIDTLALYPGIVRTEGNMAMEQRGEWKDASGGLDLNLGETPQFTGRAVATLLSRPELTKARSGKVIVVAELAKEIGFTDVDGTVPASIRNLQFILPGIVFPQMKKKNGQGSVPDWIKNNVPDVLLPWFIFSGGPPPVAE